MYTWPTPKTDKNNNYDDDDIEYRNYPVGGRMGS